MKMRWLAVPVVAGALAIGVVAAGIFAVGSASAQEADTGQSSIRQTFVAKVADILNLGEDEVRDAFQQARDEIHDEMLEAKLDSLVEEGTITEQDKADILAWLDSKPEGLPGIGMMGKRSHGFGPGGSIEDRLERAVENGVITQEMADDLLAWYESRPEVVDQLFQGLMGHGRGFHGRFRGFMDDNGEFHGRFQGRFNGNRIPGLNGAGIGERVPEIASGEAVSF